MRRWALDPRLHTLGETVFWAACGFFLSAASLGNQMQPLALGLVCAVTGWQAVLTGLGGALGYAFFWGAAGLQGVLWMGLGVLIALAFGNRVAAKTTPLLIPALGALIVSAAGVAFQMLWQDDTEVSVYLLRVVLAAGAARMFALVASRREPMADWVAGGAATLALAQVWPVSWLGLGFVAAGGISGYLSFPAAVLAGVGLDLAGVCPVPMTAVLCLAHIPRLLPKQNKLAHAVWICGAYLLVMNLLGTLELAPLPGLALGALGALLLPEKRTVPRRGETGAAQVRLELASNALSQAEQLLLEAQESPLDEQAILVRGVDRACAGCPCRKECRERENARLMEPELLHKPLLRPDDLPIHCRKSGRLLQEMQRSQEQLRQLRGSREKLKECRWAVIQQYGFLAEYLKEVSDDLSRREKPGGLEFAPEVAAVTAGRDRFDGDRCAWFAGTGGRYYVMLCDGMGTGLGAARESKDATQILEKLLRAGFSAGAALRSLNALCALRSSAGAVTVDLLEISMATGKGQLYKWGAAPSYLLARAGAIKIGTAGPPPGLSVTESRETVEGLSLRRGETLVLLSDGVDGEVVRRRLGEDPDLPAGELAARALQSGRGEGGDDASAIVVRLRPRAMST